MYKYHMKFKEYHIMWFNNNALRLKSDIDTM